MKKKRIFFCCLIMLACFSGCKSKGRLEESRADDIEVIVMETEVEEIDQEIYDVDQDKILANQDKKDVKEEGKDKEKPHLTLEELLVLVKDGHLNWTDFDMYASEDIGSGLYILMYPIDDEFSLLVGGTGQDEPMYVRLCVGGLEDYFELGKSSDSIEESRNLERFIQENRETPYYVSILAHVKEVDLDNGKDEMIISSDSDSYPGAFLVSNVREAMGNEDVKELKGGSFILILMKKVIKQEEKEGIPEYKAREIICLFEDEKDNLNIGQEDILLTSAPDLVLADPLSSRYPSINIQAGNYTWTVEEGGEEKNVVACGIDPLDKIDMQNTMKLNIPNYSTGSVLYYCSTKIKPNSLMLRQWDVSDIGKPEAREEQIIVYYDNMNFIELQGGKVYEFNLEWIKENYHKNKFYGTASYTFVTE